MSKRTFVMGDIHGAYKALVQCLERSGFDKENDTLIQLGDICDGWSEVYQCVEELLTIPNLIAIRGNHDDWFNEFLLWGQQPVSWQQGGIGTLRSYCLALDKLYYNKETGGYITSMLDTDVPIAHREFFNKQHRFYKDDMNRLFVHGGFNRHELLKDQSHEDVFWWDRDLWMSAMGHAHVLSKYKIKENVSNVFIGHTTTMQWGKDTPMQAGNIWNLDTGAGFKGKLTMMNVDTKEYFQSDEVSGLYLGEKGRN